MSRVFSSIDVWIKFRRETQAAESLQALLLIRESNTDHYIYPATHIGHTCHYREISQTQCTEVWVLVTTCYIQTIGSSARGHGRFWPITASEHFFWPLTFRHTMFSPCISVKTSTSLFFSLKIYPKNGMETKKSANPQPWISPILFQETAPLQFITATPLSEGV